MPPGTVTTVSVRAVVCGALICTRLVSMPGIAVNVFRSSVELGASIEFVLDKL